MKLFLSSEGVPRAEVLRGMLRLTTGKPRVALITNAQDPYPEVLAEARSLALGIEFGVLGYDSVHVDLRKYEGKTEELMQVLRECELVWCAGGNSFWLRYVMKTSGFDAIITPLLDEGVVYGGWSAGAVVAGPSMHPIELMDEPEKAPEVIYEGLGLVDTFIWPHWDREKYTHLQADATEAMAKCTHKTMTLKDGEVLVVEDGVQKVIH